MRKLTFINLALSAALLLSACGAQYYPNKKTDLFTSGSPTAAEFMEQENETPLEPKSDERSLGYLVRGINWMNLPNEQLSNFENNLKDEPSTNTFCTFGESVVGGSIIGLLIQASGSLFLGHKVQSTADHWFWRSLSKTAQSASRGIGRGGALGGGCYFLLAGLRPLPFDGLLGESFRSLSAALVLGGMSAAAAAPVISRMASSDWTKISDTFKGQKIADSVQKIQKWTTTSELGKGLRFRLGPGLVVVGIGAGVGVVMHRYCEEAKPSPLVQDGPRSEEW